MSKQDVNTGDNKRHVTDPITAAPNSQLQSSSSQLAATLALTTCRGPNSGCPRAVAHRDSPGQPALPEASVRPCSAGRLSQLPETGQRELASEPLHLRAQLRRRTRELAVLSQRAPEVHHLHPGYGHHTLGQLESWREGEPEGLPGWQSVWGRGYKGGNRSGEEVTRVVIGLGKGLQGW